jgi:hypothetical protein
VEPRVTITLVVMDDGRREYLFQSMTTINRLHGPIVRAVIHDDAGDSGHTQWLRETFPEWEVISTPGGRSGFAGAYRNMWTWVRDHDESPYVFTTEQDFRFTRDVDLAAMATVLAEQTHLTQLALRRQPWNDTERAAGGVVESRADEYTDCRDVDGHQWLEHRLFHTTNPSLMRRDLFTTHRWPTGPHSEGRFSHEVFTDSHRCAGFWGSRDSGEWVDHIGHTRVGHGY